MSPEHTVLVGVTFYLALTLTIGFLAGRRVADAEDYLLAGRSIPMWLCTFTLFATWFGGGTCLGAAGAAYSQGLLGVMEDPFGAALCLLLCGIFYMHVFCRLGVLTAVDLFRIRFDERTERLAAWLYGISYVIWVASQFVAFGYVLSTLTGLAPPVAIVVGSTIVLAYTSFGGMWAVAATDLVQSLVLIFGLLVLFPLVLHTGGGWDALIARLPAGRLDLLPSGGVSEWAHYVEAWLVIGLGSVSGQELIQRALSSRNEKEARISALLASGMYLAFGLLPVFLGLFGGVLLGGLEDPEQVLLLLGLNHLHPVAMAAFGGALISAIMSSADSALLALACVVGENVYRRRDPDMDDETFLRLCRRAVVLAGGLSLVLALSVREVYGLLILAAGVGLVSIVVPMTAGLYWRRANTTGALASMAGGGLTCLALRAAHPELPADLLGFLASLVLMVVVSLATGRSDPPRELLDVKGEPVDLGLRATRQPPVDVDIPEHGGLG